MAMQQYPIRAVARLTGLSVDTLRAWERRYEAVAPDRSGRGRMYSDADVERLKQLSELVSRGHAISTIAGLSDTALARLLKREDAHAAKTEPPAAVRVDPLTAALDRYDLDAIETILNRHLAVLPPRELVFSVVLPLLREIGERWKSGRLRPAQEHLVSAIVRSTLGSLLRTVNRPDATPRVIFATGAGERHELGLLCAAVLTAAAGFGVIYLGPDLPAADVLHAASTAGARVVIIAATTRGAVAQRDARQLARLPAGVELWIGGPEAATLVGAIGDRARPVVSLDEVSDMLARHAR